VQSNKTRSRITKKGRTISQSNSRFLHNILTVIIAVFQSQKKEDAQKERLVSLKEAMPCLIG